MVIIDRSKETIKNLEAKHRKDYFKLAVMLGARNDRIKQLEEENKKLKNFKKAAKENLTKITYEVIECSAEQEECKYERHS